MVREPRVAVPSPHREGKCNPRSAGAARVEMQPRKHRSSALFPPERKDLSYRFGWKANRKLALAARGAAPSGSPGKVRPDGYRGQAHSRSRAPGLGTAAPRRAPTESGSGPHPHPLHLPDAGAASIHSGARRDAGRTGRAAGPGRYPHFPQAAVLPRGFPGPLYYPVFPASLFSRYFIARGWRWRADLPSKCLSLFIKVL